MQTISQCEIPGDHERLLDIARRAARTGRILIQRGGSVLISPDVLPGWHIIGVIVK